MAQQTLVVDTSILIDYFRKTNKQQTWFVELSKTYPVITITSITEFEIYTGASSQQLPFWQQLLVKVPIMAFDSNAAQVAVVIPRELKMSGKSIDKADLFIVATVRASGLPLATLNRKHFQIVEDPMLL